VRYWRMISCLHSSDPVSSEGEMRTGPIWNNRIPFAIVFLSVSLFLCPTMGTNARIGYPPVYACVVTNARVLAVCERRDGEGEVWRQESAHLRSRNAVYTYGSRAIILSAHRHITPGTLCDPCIRIPSACIMLLLRFSWKTSSTDGARRQRVVKEIPMSTGTNAPHTVTHRRFRCVYAPLMV